MDNEIPTLSIDDDSKTAWSREKGTLNNRASISLEFMKSSNGIMALFDIDYFTEDGNGCASINCYYLSDLIDVEFFISDDLLVEEPFGESYSFYRFKTEDDYKLGPGNREVVQKVFDVFHDFVCEIDNELPLDNSAKARSFVLNSLESTVVSRLIDQIKKLDVKEFY